MAPAFGKFVLFTGAMRAPFVASLCVLLACGTAQAQLSRPNEPITGPALPLAAPGDPLTLDINPAELAMLDAWGLTYIHSDAGSSDPLVGRGDAFYLGAPLPLGLGVGVGGSSIRPTAATGAADRGSLSFGLAWAPGRRFGAGAAVRYLATDAARLDGLTSVDFALNARPSSRLALALIGRDLGALVDMTGADQRVESSFLLATTLRPYGTDAVTFEVAGAVDTEGRLGTRGLLAFALPRVGRATAAVEVEDLADGADWRVIGGMQLNWGALGAGGGVIAGDDFQGGPGWYVSAHLSGARRRPSLPTPRYIANVEVRNGLGKRSVLDRVRLLEGALHDERVAGVLLRLRSTGIGLAYAQELRLMIDALEDAGKRVVCHLDSASGAEYYACAAASATLIDPAGGIRLLGPSMDVVLLGELLDRVGLRADFVRIGRYKSAVEQLENARSSDAARAQREALLDDVHGRLLHDLAGDLDRERDDVGALVDDGPYAAPEALDAGLVTEEADERELERDLRPGFGESFRMRDYRPDGRSGVWGVPPRIGVVVVDGTIVDGDNVDIPFLDVHMSGSRTVIGAIERLARDPTVKAIVLRVDSPGGSALASDQIWRAVRRARRRKPVIASLGAVAASGGYYVASAAEEIWTDPATVTGSIGIFFGKVDVGPLAERVGVSVEQLRRGRHAGAESLWRGYTAQERAMLSDKIRIWYRLFLERVARGRGMDAEQVHALGQGRVWSGDAAVRKGLADRLGGFGSALARARELARLEPDAEVVIVPSRPQTLLDYVLGASDQTRARAAAVPDSVREAAAIAATFGHVRPGTAMALLPAVVELH